MKSRPGNGLFLCNDLRSRLNSELWRYWLRDSIGGGVVRTWFSFLARQTQPAPSSFCSCHFIQKFLLFLQDWASTCIWNSYLLILLVFFFSSSLPSFTITSNIDLASLRAGYQTLPTFPHYHLSTSTNFSSIHSRSRCSLSPTTLTNLAYCCWPVLAATSS